MAYQQQIVNQYRTSANLDARISLHERFSTNPYRWMPWVFDHLRLSSDCRGLEVGSGVGKLWLENAHRIRPSWRIVLSDFSTAMLEKTRANLASIVGSFSYGCFGVERIPFRANIFDVVIANHMLYYPNDLDQALSEIRRVLKRGGKLFASTNGMNHLREIDDLLVGFRGGTRPVASVIQAFSLDNGLHSLQRHFDEVVLDRYEDSLIVNDSAALSDYCLSMTRAEILAGQQKNFIDYIDRAVRKHGGQIRITKDTGLFSATKV